MKSKLLWKRLVYTLGKISVIIPVYNAEKYIEKCIDSIICQTYKEIEIIAVNDGSEDNSLSLLQKYKDVIKIIDKPNSGVSNTRNMGLQHANGEYIMFVDSDDWLDKDCIYDCLKKSQNADIIRFKLNYVYSNGSSFIEEDDFLNETLIDKTQFKDTIYTKILTGIALNSICRTIFKRRVLEGIKFREDLKTAEDLIFNIEAFSNANSFIYISKGYYNYYQTTQGLTGRGLSIFKKYKYNLIVRAEILKRLESWGMNNFKYCFLASIRILIITYTKIKIGKKY